MVRLAGRRVKEKRGWKCKVEGLGYGGYVRAGFGLGADQPEKRAHRISMSEILQRL
jgi:hypothetical protein